MNPRALDEVRAWDAVRAVAPGEDGWSPVPGLRVHRDGGWAAEEGLQVTPEAATVLDVFLPLRVRERFVVAQLGQSLDGRIATGSGHSHYINGPEDIRRLHRLRALADAVVVGAGTVDSDDPRLTVREVPGPNPVRVVLDPRGRLDPTRGVFTDGAAPTLWIQGGHPDPGNEMAGGTLQVLRIPTSGDGFDPWEVVETLRTRGLPRILVEGGGITVSRFLQARALDRLHLSVAALIMGSGRPSITLPPIDTLEEALRPAVRHFTLGTDLLFDLELFPESPV